MMLEGKLFGMRKTKRPTVEDDKDDEDDQEDADENLNSRPLSADERRN